MADDNGLRNSETHAYPMGLFSRKEKVKNVLYRVWRDSLAGISDAYPNAATLTQCHSLDVISWVDRRH
jgi:hypothetical protein